MTKFRSIIIIIAIFILGRLYFISLPKYDGQSNLNKRQDALRGEPIFASSVNERPVIGILILESHLQENKQNFDYLPSSYVKYFESLGASVIPIHYDQSQQQLQHILQKINAAVIPSQAIDMDTIMHEEEGVNFEKNHYLRSVRQILDYSRLSYLGIGTENNLRRIFPVWATSLSVVKRAFSAKPVSKIPLQNKSGSITILQDSYLFEGISEHLIKAMRQQNILYFDHIYSESPDDFASTNELSSWLKITSISSNNFGIEFVSSCEGKEGLPIYITEFHLEKHSFEWKKNLEISHKTLSLEVALYIGQKFMSKIPLIKLNGTLDLSKMSISNFQPQLSQSNIFNTIYLFPKDQTAEKLNLRPFVGVFTQPSMFDNYPSANYSYIPNSYVQFIENSGAQVIPINYTWDEETLNLIFQQINGILVPGGDASFIETVNKDGSIVYTQFGKAVNYMLNLTIAANDKGDYFPFWGTCNGFEGILIMTQNASVLDYLADDNRSENITMINQVQSRLYSKMSPSEMQYIQAGGAAYFNHDYGISTQNFTKFDKIDQFFYVTSVAYNLNGTEFVSTIEAKNYPIYGTQYHPEKNQFEWYTNIDINHDPRAIDLSQYTGQFFVNECRKNGHSFQSQEAANQFLIYQYCRLQATPAIFMSVYFFNNVS